MLFSKEISQITKEDLASIVSLDFYYQDYYYKKVRCEMNIGDDSIMCYNNPIVNDGGLSNKVSMG